ncbi:succinate dehydrogenase, hydrophobic membrane anchor protein [Pelagibacteraceae bacterium]|jgi:succinate dehydrogenase / fumarate reductase membrane anchor subunit|nr:succinate dehydrogenase, hydrophobic membrane anchor protein [Pelagibacteraceae bacterium]
MHHSTKKWLFIKLSSVILIPLMFWFIINLASIYDGEYTDIIGFFSKTYSKILYSLFVIAAFSFFSLTISEVFEDYIKDEKTKNVATKMLYMFAIIIPIVTILGILRLN